MTENVQIETKPVGGAPVETPSRPPSAKSTGDIAGAGSPVCTACSCGRSDHGGYRKLVFHLILAAFPL